MVSSEGACAAYYNFGRMHREAAVTLGARAGGGVTTATLPPSPTGRVRHRIRVTGVVQGVGFRPFVHRLATELGLGGLRRQRHRGRVRRGRGSERDAGSASSPSGRRAPPLARIDAVRSRRRSAPGGDRGFRIVASRRATGAPGRSSSPDVAVCDDCLAELFDPADRRYRYPFINCTNCGPRFTITVRLPYDRPNTTMAGFAPVRRLRRPSTTTRPTGASTPSRWPARPAGPGCGSRSQAGGTACRRRTDRGDCAGRPSGAWPAARSWRSRASAATTWPATPPRRRRWPSCAGASSRPDKPFAVMVADLAAAARLADRRRRRGGELLDQPAAAHRPARPGRPRTRWPPWWRRATRYVGVLLPVHPAAPPAVPPVPGAGAPVRRSAGDDQRQPERRAHLLTTTPTPGTGSGHIADAWLVHDRPIHVPCDDSVVRVETGGSCRSAAPGATPRCRSRLPVRRRRRCWPPAAS